MKTLFAAFVIYIAFGTASGTLLAQPVVMKLTTTGIEDPQTKMLDEFKRRLDARSGGKIKAEIYPGGQLGTIPRLIEGMQLGTIESYTVPPEFLTGLDPRFQVIVAPGLFDDVGHAWRTLTDPAFRDPYLAMAEGKGVKGLNNWVYGLISIACTSPIKLLSDLQGKKIRVLATDLEIALMRKFGAAGIPMTMDEVMPALQNRQIDGIRTSTVVMNTRKHYSVAKNLTLMNDAINGGAMLVSTKFMDKLPAELKKLVIDVAQEIEPLMLDIVDRFEAEAVSSWKKNGGNVIELSDAHKKQYMHDAQLVADEVFGKNPEVKKMYELLKATAARHKKG
jgi:TRAP-type C4-dicarboxylate transport system substrate-binding protein